MNPHTSPLLVPPVLSRWRSEEKRAGHITRDILAGQDWTRHLLENKDLGWQEIKYLSSCPKKRLDSDAAPRDLRGFTFRDIDLTGNQGLSDSCLDYSIFDGVLLRDSSFTGSSLRFTRISTGSVLDGALFRFADVRGAQFQNISMRGADFSNANIENANFTESDIEGLVLKDVKYSSEGTLGLLTSPSGWTKFGGKTQQKNILSNDSDSNISTYISNQCSRFLFEDSHPILGKVSYLLTNFGQSPWRLCLWVVGLWLTFGIIYASPSLPKALEDTQIGNFLIWCSPKLFDTRTDSELRHPVRALYFSAVTLTSLGFGDIVPDPSDWKSHLYVCLESILGYLLLGAFVSLLLKSFDSSYS